jgi:hypothetical protein
MAQQVSTTLYKVHAGRLTRHYIPVEGRSIGLDLHGYPTLATQGCQHGYVDPWVLPRALEICTLMAPWCSVYLAPDFSGQDGCAGRAYTDRDICIIKTNRSPIFILSTVVHECWHSIESVLTQDELACLDSHVVTGDSMPDDYYASAQERRARAAEAYFSVYLETGTFPVSCRAHRIFRQAFDGRLAKRGSDRWLAPHERPAVAPRHWIATADWISDRIDGIFGAVADVWRAVA